MRVMKERELAEQIEAMRDDAEAWGEPGQQPVRKRKSERRLRGAMVSVRFSPDELAAVQAHAVKAGTSVSGFLRDLALARARQPTVAATWAGPMAFNASSTDERNLTREVQILA